MQMRVFGRTGMRLSVLGFGCGAVGGFMVRGDPADQERTIARAIAAGVNYFDTAVQYGNGESVLFLRSPPKNSNGATASPLMTQGHDCLHNSGPDVRPQDLRATGSSNARPRWR